MFLNCENYSDRLSFPEKTIICLMMATFPEVLWVGLGLACLNCILLVALLVYITISRESFTFRWLHLDITAGYKYSSVPCPQVEKNSWPSVLGSIF